MTSIDITLSKEGLAARWVDRGISEQAWKLAENIGQNIATTVSISLWEPLKTTLRQLEDLRSDLLSIAEEPGSVSHPEPATFQYARQFLSLLPNDVPPPELSVDDDGDIRLEWDRGRRKVFAVSVSRDGTLNYAGLFGYSKSHGVEVLRDTLPGSVRQNLARITEEVRP